MQEQRINKYNKYVVAEDFLLVSNYNSVMQFPFFLRAVINTTSKEYLTEKRLCVNALAALFLLSGQRNIPTRAKKSIAGFKLRKGALIGCQTTLRKKKLYTILDKLLIFVLPRVYSEKRNEKTIEMTSLLFLKKSLEPFKSLQIKQKRVTATTKSVSFTVKEDSKGGQLSTQTTKVLSPCERTRLSMFFNFLKEDTSKSVTKIERITSKGAIYHLALGIKDLLLMPELQGFLPFFESVRGINIGVSFSNPRIKRTPLPATFFSSRHNFPPENLMPQVLGEKILRDTTHPHKLSKQINGVKGVAKQLLKVEKKLIDSEDIAYFTYNMREGKEAKERATLSFQKNARVMESLSNTKAKTYQPSLQGSTYRKEEMEITGLLCKKKECLEIEGRNDSQQVTKNTWNKTKKSLLQKVKSTFTQKEYREEKHTLNTFCIPLDTSFSKENRKLFFLTCFQYPRQYN
jgi:hypothetical protein